MNHSNIEFCIIWTIVFSKMTIRIPPRRKWREAESLSSRYNRRQVSSLTSFYLAFWLDWDVPLTLYAPWRLVTVEGRPSSASASRKAQRRDVESAIHFSYDRALAPIKVSTLETTEVQYHNVSTHLEVRLQGWRNVLVLVTTNRTDMETMETVIKKRSSLPWLEALTTTWWLSETLGWVE